MNDDMNDMISEFLVECSENLEEFEVNLLELEKEPAKAELVDSMFRMVHSIKGASGFLAFSHLETLTHKAENVLGLIRDDKGSVDGELISTFLAVCDAVKDMFKSIEDHGNDGQKTHDQLISRLKVFEDSFSGVVETVSQAENISSSQEKVEDTSGNEDLDEVQLEALRSLGLAPPEEAPAPAAEAAPAGDLDEVQLEALRALGIEPEPSSPVAKAEAEEPEELKSEEKAKVVESKKVNKKETIRVDVDTLNQLVNFAGELVLVRNQLLELSKQNDSRVFSASFNELNLITGEIQRSLMTTRMQPISSIWGKIPRVVRDLSMQVNKKVEVIMEGEATELDRTVLEAIADPMTHIIRNCVDHGLETPEDRIAAGKPEVGIVKLEAEHRGNWIHIDVVDDGRGISCEKLRAKALEKELYTQEQLDAMTEKEVLNLIFHAGFSTKDQVSNISGRGVGMDVIRSNITKINGSVEIHSEEDIGTTLKIRLPLTLAIVPAVIVAVGSERYALPQNSVQEVASADAKEIERFDDIGGQKFTRLRGQILPLVFGSEFLELESNNKSEDSLNYVVVNADGYSYGLVIDSVLDIVEIVVKPLDSEDKNFDYFAGATIMGDGKVAMILDVVIVAQKMNIEQIHEDQLANIEDIRSSLNDSGSLSLLFELSDQKSYLVPLDKTNRIEEISKSEIEECNIGKFAKFNGGLIRILDLNTLLGINVHQDDEDEETVRVLYYEVGGHGIGVNVGFNQRLHQEGFEIESSTDSEFIVGTTLIEDSVYEVLDLGTYIDQIMTEEVSNKATEINGSELYENLLGQNAVVDVNNQVLSFRLGDLLLGIRLSAINEIITREEVTETPGSDETVKGLLNLRGNILVSKSLQEILRLDLHEEGEGNSNNNSRTESKSIILSSEGKGLCLQINQINEILDLESDSFSSVPTNIPENIRGYLSSVCKLDEELLLLLDESKLIAVNDYKGAEV